MQATLAQSCKSARGRWLLIVALLFSYFSVLESQPVVVKWNQPSGVGGEWESAANWMPPRVPKDTDLVSIPANSGKITVEKQVIVKDFRVEESDNKDKKTVITSRNPQMPAVLIKTTGGPINVGGGNEVRGRDAAEDGDGGSVNLDAGTSSVTVGKGSLVRGGNGLGGGDGGRVTILTQGMVTNNGKIMGGAGGDFAEEGIARKGKGGNVSVAAETIENNGVEKGGRGGNNPAGTGGMGGSVFQAGKKTGIGKKKKGTGGDGLRKGADGIARIHGEEEIRCKAGDVIEAAQVEMTTGSDGQIILAGCGPNFIVATGAVCISTCATCPIDLRENPAGSQVIQSEGEIVMFGQILLDPGVALSDLTEPDAVLAETSCASRLHSIPATSQIGLLLLAALLGSTAIGILGARA